MKYDRKLIARQNALAREICLASGFLPDAPIRPDGNEPRWMEFLGEAVVQLRMLDQYAREQAELDALEAGARAGDIGG